MVCRLSLGAKKQHQRPPAKKKARTTNSPTRAGRRGPQLPADADKVWVLGLGDQGQQGDKGMQ
jgi:hypothetical protein